MGSTTLNAGMLAPWFEILLLFVTMVFSGILFRVMQPVESA